MGHVINFDQSQSENFRNKKSAAKIRNTKILAFWLVNYDCINLNILHFDWLNLLQLKKKNWGWGGKIFSLGSFLPLSSSPLFSSTLSLLSSPLWRHFLTSPTLLTHLWSPLCPFYFVSLTLVSVYLFTFLRFSCLSIVQYHICQTAIAFSFSIVSTTCAGWAYSTDTYLLSHIQLVSAPLLSIHSSVPHLPDSDSIFVLHSLYHMCKLGLFHWHLPFVTYSARSCAVAVHP